MRKKEDKKVSVGREINGEIVIRFTNNLMSSHKTKDGNKVIYVTIPVQNKLCSLVFDEKIVHEDMYGTGHWVKVSVEKSTLVIERELKKENETSSCPPERQHRVLNGSLGKYFNYEETHSRQSVNA